ncbi:MAG: hypothetical protein IJ634_00360 [Bacteroidales bacterium]|nr:hypothetical protein [Bacteroidales bacterium]
MPHSKAFTPLSRVCSSHVKPTTFRKATACTMAAQTTGRQKPALLAMLPQMQMATSSRLTPGTTLCQKTL